MEAARLSREQLLANCRWYFCQDVQIITLHKPDKFDWRGAVMPAASSLRSVSDLGGNKDVLLFVTGVKTFEEVFGQLLTKINFKIGEIYSEGGPMGCFIVNAPKLPRHIHMSAPSEPLVGGTTTSLRDATATQNLHNEVRNMERRLESLERATAAMTGTEAHKRPDIMPTANDCNSMDKLATILQRMERTMEVIENYPRFQNWNRDTPHTSERQSDPWVHNSAPYVRNDVGLQPPCRCSTHLAPHSAPNHLDRTAVPPFDPTIVDRQQALYGLSSHSRLHPAPPLEFHQQFPELTTQGTETHTLKNEEKEGGNSSKSEIPITANLEMVGGQSSALADVVVGLSADQVQEEVGRQLAIAMSALVSRMTKDSKNED